ncbi:Sorting nexin [Lachnellula willkommii]|uniref:Sorting nexin MVP1 n=1 Tax=Lachnellula willkommii TaxID=215461 RepID=A0A559MLF6_9HELO|nr:Sorting nexin [Lachnellula willkommii]
MSLFGSSPEESAPINTAASKSRNSLFADEGSPAGSKSTLFAEDDAPTSSPWGMPTPKKAARSDLIKNLLDSSSVPDSYIDTFDNLLKVDGRGGKVTPAGITNVLSAGNLGADEQSRITNLITSGGQLTDLSRNEFNVLLALVGLAQEHEDITLDGVDERRRTSKYPTSSSCLLVSPKAANNAKKKSLDFPEVDPWASPAMHKGHDHNASPPKANGISNGLGNGLHAPSRTTSNFTTTSAEGNGSSEPPAGDVPSTPAWGAYDGASSAPFSNPGESPIGGDGFGGSGGGGGDRPTSNTPARSFGGGRVTNGGPEENISVALLPEKEGMFMFQHHNYQVSSPRRGSKVVRRYSDFVWLLDCLHKRYPFRQLPLLPPKRVGVNGNHLAADSTFIEKRRRGLARFANALVRHPILGQEQLVIMFLTVPTELAVWRKQATISVQEEFVGKPLPPGLEDSLPTSLNELFETTRTGVRRSAEIYINLCNLLDRLAKRNEGLAADQLRLSLSLQSLTDVSKDTYSTDTNDVPLLNEGIHAMAKHVSNSQSLLEDEAKAWDQGVLEDLKRHVFDILLALK